MTQLVRQVRICIEVLRSYLQANGLPHGVARQRVLAQAERDYRTAAYGALLRQAGTTFEELRLAHSATIKTLNALADRLGLAPPRLEELELDPENESALTERALERIFGLADTARDPLSMGARLGDPHGRLIRWSLRGTVWNKNTDADGRVHVRLRRAGDNDYRVELYRDRERTQLVAYGEASLPVSTVQIAEQDGSGLTGRFAIDLREGSEVCEIAVVPDLLSWRLQHLRELWKDQDHPQDTYSTTAVEPLTEADLVPMIDPDVIGPDDLRHPEEGQPAFNLWLQRRAEVDRWLDELQGERANGLESALRLVLGDPLPDLDSLRERLRGTLEQIESARAEIERLRFTVASFIRLMAIRAKDRLRRINPANEEVTADEWLEMDSILAQVQKKREFSAWRQQEQDSHLLLGPRDFWMPLREPIEGEWPISPVDAQPLIDPSVLSRDDLPEPGVGETAIRMWGARQARLQAIPGELRAAHSAHALDGLLAEAFGVAQTLDDLDALRRDLASPDRAASARTTLANVLHLSEEDFQRLLQILEKSREQEPARRPNDEEWGKVYALLTQPRKITHDFPLWVQEEEQAGLRRNYWRALKARLPRWRSSKEDHQKWQEALRSRSKAPVIDPDLIHRGYLIDPLNGQPARLWDSRNRWLHGRLSALEEMRDGAATDLAGIDAIIQESLGVSAVELSGLANSTAENADPTARLQQLALPLDALQYLLRIRKLAELGERVLNSEWADVYAILVQVEKRREVAHWRQDDYDQGVILGPDHFMIPEAPIQFPPPGPSPLPAWRAARRDLLDWEETLQSRKDQEKALIDGWWEAVSSVEERTLPSLRDALAEAIGEADEDFKTKAKWIVDNLLIDARAGGCQKTTRISQAIETIQGLLWSVRTGQTRDTLQGIILDADDFDKEWEWIGSYATWRAAMFVFLYPENILLPSLRRWQTPGFVDLVNQVRANPRLTPEGACEAAQRYSEYYQDICSLMLEASCHARTRIYRGECRNRVETAPRCLFYLFARSSLTQTVYWSALDQGGTAGYEQSFWAPVSPLEGVSVVNVIGAVPYQIAPEQRFIFLFVRINDAGKQKLGFVKWDLEKQRWSGDIVELDLPEPEGEETAFFEAVVKQTYTEDEPPHLAVQIEGGAIYERQFNREGTGWAEIRKESAREEQQQAEQAQSDETSGAAAEPSDDWVPLVLESRGRDFVLRAMVAINVDESLLVGERASHSSYRLWYRLLGPNDDGHWLSCAQGDFLGSFRWPGSDDVYVFFQGDFGSEYRVIRHAASSAEFANEIRSIDVFNDWLRNITGLTLADWTVRDPDAREDSGRNLLSFLMRYEAVWPNTEWTPIQEQIAFLAEALEKGERQEWNRANHWVRKFNSAGATIPDLLKYCFFGAAGVPEVLFIERAPEEQLPDYTSAGYRGVNVGSIAPVSGVTDKFQVAAGGQDRLGTRRVRRYFTARQGDELQIEKFWAAPVVSGPFEITESLSRNTLQERRAAIETQFDDNEDHPRSDLTYLEEAYYFVLVHLALELQREGHYIAALDWFRTVYDYSASPAERKIFPLLRDEESLSWDFRRSGQWLLDPLNPHSIAATRAETYTRFTLLALVRCLLDYADSEFTRDTAESVPRARTLYLTALELLNSSELSQSVGDCGDLIGTLAIEIAVEDRQWQSVWDRILRALGEMGDYSRLVHVIREVREAAAGPGGWARRVGRMFDVVHQERAERGGWRGYQDVIGHNQDRRARAELAMFGVPTFARAAKTLVEVEKKDFLRGVSLVSGISAPNLVSGRRDVPWLGQRREYAHDGNGAGQPNPLGFAPGGNGNDLRVYDPLAPTALATMASFAAAHPLQALGMIQEREPLPFLASALAFDFCIPPNPVLKALRFHAELNLYKIRTCRNIAGMERELEPFAAPTDVESGLPMIGAGGQLVLPGLATIRPTQYRYTVLIERAKQLAQLAAQMEAGLLSAIEKRDQEAYQVLKARQDLRLARAGVRLQDLKVREAEDDVMLAELQRERTEIEIDHYRDWLSEPISAKEEASLALMQSSAILSTLSATNYSAGAANLAAAVITLGASVTEQAAAAFGALAAAASAQAGMLSAWADYERRAEEWQLRLDLARQDSRIADQNMRLATDRVRIVGQERHIAGMQADHAQEVSEFLATKFTNVELYDWMSRCLRGGLQLFPPAGHCHSPTRRTTNWRLSGRRRRLRYIQADYWEVPSEARGQWH